MSFPGEVISGELIARILQIVLIDLVLSGDNAVVIGMAAHPLPPPVATFTTMPIPVIGPDKLAEAPDPTVMELPPIVRWFQPVARGLYTRLAGEKLALTASST